uniref:Uncharacterized protein n=1 Tax=Heterorhabditis bacteriophora TaxID=37862 RepID=A0A1I7WRC6_HETBA
MIPYAGWRNREYRNKTYDGDNKTNDNIHQTARLTLQRHNTHERTQIYAERSSVPRVSRFSRYNRLAARPEGAKQTTRKRPW